MESVFEAAWRRALGFKAAGSIRIRVSLALSPWRYTGLYKGYIADIYGVYGGFKRESLFGFVTWSTMWSQAKRQVHFLSKRRPAICF